MCICFTSLEAQIQFPTQFAQQGAPELLDPQGRLRQPGDLETDLMNASISGVALCCNPHFGVGQQHHFLRGT
jgi:hypothetical protein